MVKKMHLSLGLVAGSSLMQLSEQAGHLELRAAPGRWMQGWAPPKGLWMVELPLQLAPGNHSIPPGLSVHLPFRQLSRAFLETEHCYGRPHGEAEGHIFRVSR